MQAKQSRMHLHQGAAMHMQNIGAVHFCEQIRAVHFCEHTMQCIASSHQLDNALYREIVNTSAASQMQTHQGAVLRVQKNCDVHCCAAVNHTA